MIPTYEFFEQRAIAVRHEIAAACSACGRSPDSVELLAVTKTHGPWAPAYAARFGLRGVGENRVQEAVDKMPQVAWPAGMPRPRWELIGHLQSNKARLAAAHFDRVQSVDSPKLLTRLDQAAADQGRPLAVLLQINAGHDPAKYGADPAAAPALLEHALGCRHLRIEGLMTIAPLADDLDVARRTFTHLRTLRDDLAARFRVALPELSMGMSGDLAAAIAAGSTQVRVGTALFGAR